MAEAEADGSPVRERVAEGTEGDAATVTNGLAAEEFDWDVCVRQHRHGDLTFPHTVEAPLDAEASA